MRASSVDVTRRSSLQAVHGLHPTPCLGTNAMRDISTTLYHEHIRQGISLYTVARPPGRTSGGYGIIILPLTDDLIPVAPE